MNIREYKDKDLESIMQIWLSENIKAHDFIPKSYWINNFEYVKCILPKSEIYVYECNNRIYGFVGLNNNYIAGIFVSSAVQSEGIGKQLMDYVKKIKSELSLNVYRKNLRAIQFYKREGFRIIDKSNDENTMETEYTMLWNKIPKAQ